MCCKECNNLLAGRITVHKVLLQLAQLSQRASLNGTVQLAGHLHMCRQLGQLIPAEGTQHGMAQCGEQLG